MVVGSDGPFAADRPALGGAPAAGTPLATTNGTWTGTPTFAYAWMRCDAAGGGCAPIAGADGASYTPTADDVGSTLRSRVTATQGAVAVGGLGAVGGGRGRFTEWPGRRAGRRRRTGRRQRR